MGDTWISDLRHFLDKDGAIAPKAGPAKRMADYLTRIVMDATTSLHSVSIDAVVRCRRRPGRRPCPGEIETDIDSETSQIVWWCPACGDNGYIRNWKGSLWDCTPHGHSH